MTGFKLNQQDINQFAYQSQPPITGSTLGFYNSGNIAPGGQPFNYAPDTSTIGAGGLGFGAIPSGSAMGGGMPPVTAGGLGFNMGTANLAFNGLSSLTGLYTGLQGLKLAKQQFQFGKDMALRNEKNAVGDYNNQLRDQQTTRAQFNQSAPGTAEVEYQRRKAVSA